MHADISHILRTDGQCVMSDTAPPIIGAYCVVLAGTVATIVAACLPLALVPVVNIITLAALNMRGASALKAFGVRCSDGYV